MRHPVLGPVACLVAVKQIAKGEEVFNEHCSFLSQCIFGCLALPRNRGCFLFNTKCFWLPGIAKVE